MDVEVKAGWIYAVRQLAAELTEGQSEAVAALSPIADPSTATAEDVAEAYNSLLSALQGV